MGHGGLAQVAAVGEVAGADLAALTQLAEDRESCRVRGGLQKEHVRIGLAFHTTKILTSVYIVKYQYSERRHR